MRKGVKNAVAVIIAAAISLFIIWNALLSSTEAKGADQVAASSAEDDGFWKTEKELESDKNVTLSLKEAILGDSEAMKKLEVFQQEISDVTKYTDTGKLPWHLSQKSQYIKYSGTAIYTVDLEHIDEDHVVVDVNEKTVTILIPHVEERLDIDEDETQAEETVHEGIFSIGDLKMSQDTMKEVIAQVKIEMEETLQAQKVSDNADRMARMQVWEIYQPVISQVSPEYTVQVDFEVN